MLKIIIPKVLIKIPLALVMLQSASYAVALGAIMLMVAGWLTATGATLTLGAIVMGSGLSEFEVSMVSQARGMRSADRFSDAGSVPKMNNLDMLFSKID